MDSWQPAPRDRAAVERVANTLQAASSWLIVTHERPDGDALGSAFAMAYILEALGKSWTFLLAEELPSRFHFLPWRTRARQITAADAGAFSHVVAVDCADERRFAQVNAAFAEGAQVVNVDHHQTNPRYGFATYVDPEAAATSELIYHIAKQFQVPMHTDLAVCLYTGILTDTGGFRYPSTTSSVHQIAAQLIACGVRPYDVAEATLESRSRAQMMLLQMALKNLTISADGRYAFILVDRQMLNTAGANEDDVEGLVEFARSVDTVEIGVLLRERADGTVKASLRSKRHVDVAQIAALFDGGGHVRAAGCELSGPMAVAHSRVETAVKAALEAVRR